MQPCILREKFAAADIRTWFDLADTNGDGTLSVNEFFTWSLGKAQQQVGGCALQAAFERYDRDGTGRLDSMEFATACADLGFGPMARDIFSTLDTDGSGTISYPELVTSLTAQVPDEPQVKGMLSAMVLLSTSPRVARGDCNTQIDTSNWVITGSDAATVQTQLQDLLQQSGGLVADLLLFFDEDMKARGGSVHLAIDDGEFRRTMRNKLGFRGEPRVLTEIFEILDTDGSGRIGFDELCNGPKTKPWIFRLP